MTILVIAEHDHKAIQGATLNAIAAAQKIGGDIHVLVAGSNPELVGGAEQPSVAGRSSCRPASRIGGSAAGGSRSVA